MLLAWSSNLTFWLDGTGDVMRSLKLAGFMRTTNATSKVHVTLTGTFKIKLNILLCANFVLIL